MATVALFHVAIEGIIVPEARDQHVEAAVIGIPDETVGGVVKVCTAGVRGPRPGSRYHRLQVATPAQAVQYFRGALS